MNEIERLKSRVAVLENIIVGLLDKVTEPEIRHRLHADGETDDTAALQALANGELVEGPRGGIIGGGDTVYLPAGEYRISDMISSGTTTLDGGKSLDGDVVIRHTEHDPRNTANGWKVTYG